MPLLQSMKRADRSLRGTKWLLIGFTVLLVLLWQAPPLRILQGADIMPIWLHVFAEMFSIVVAMLIFAVGWNAYSKERPGNIVILACAFLAVGLIDFAHTLSFNGMPDFITPAAREKGLNFWLSARFVAALALLAVGFRSWQPLTNSSSRYGLLAGSLGVAAMVYWLGLFHQELWPRTFIEGQGLTPFKIAAEYTIIAILLVSASLFYLCAKQSQSHDCRSLFAAAAITILSELCFTLYSAARDGFNLLGHTYKVVAYLYLYRAIFVSSVREPFRKMHVEMAERKRAEAALKESESYSRMLFENAPIGLAVCKMDGTLTDINQAYADILGRSIDETKGLTYWQVTPENYGGQEQQQLESLKATGRFGPYEKEYLHRDGQRVPVRLTGRLIERNGEHFIWSSVENIAQRKESEKALQRLTQLYKMLNHTHAEIIHATDREQLFQALCRIAMDSGLFAMVWIGLLDTESGAVRPVAHAGLVEGDLDSLNVNIHDGETGSGPLGTSIRNGRPMISSDIEQDPDMRPWREAALKRGYRALAVFPVRQGDLVIGAFSLYFNERGIVNDDIVQLIVGLVEDVSFALDFMVESRNRKRAEQEIRKLNSELELRVLERTQQLQQANKELESFSYSVSHDLRAPLRSIDGFSEILEKRYGAGLDEAAKGHLNRVRRASQRMGELIDDLLQLARVSRTELSKKPVDLSALVRTIIASLQETQPARQVDFTIADGVIVDADQRLIRGALENLLGNAWKFTAHQMHPHIEFGSLEIQGEKVLYVRDNGAGFDMQYANKLFGAFQRLHKTDEYEGTGIGLATVQRIVHRHNGRVWAEGEIGKGAIIYFTL